MAGKKQNAGAASEPVDASKIPQESSLEKPSADQVPSREGIQTRGYYIPETFRALEEADGDIEKAAAIMAESSDAPLYQDEVNAKADAEQKEAMKRAGREYRVPGQKAAAGPAENKSASAKK